MNTFIVFISLECAPFLHLHLASPSKSSWFTTLLHHFSYVRVFHTLETSLHGRDYLYYLPEEYNMSKNSQDTTNLGISTRQHKAQEIRTNQSYKDYSSKWTINKQSKSMSNNTFSYAQQSRCLYCSKPGLDLPCIGTTTFHVPN